MSEDNTPAENTRDPIVVIDSDKASQVVIFGQAQTGAMIGQFNKDGKTVNDRPTSPASSKYTLSVTGDEDVTIDLNRAAESGTEMIEIEAEGRDSQQTTLTNFTGKPPVKIDDGAVSIESSSREAFGFKPRQTEDGTIEVTSNIELAKDEDGNILIQRDGQTIMTVEKDAKADFRDADGNIIFSIDGKDGLKKNQENLLAAEEKAFKQYQKDIQSDDPELRDPDLADEKLVHRAGGPTKASEPVKEDPGILGSFGSLGGEVAAKAKSEAAGMQSKLVNEGVDVAKTTALNAVGIPTLPGVVKKLL